MKMEWADNKEREAAAVIPTADMSQERVADLVKELDEARVDALLVEDTLPAFSFSRSMNAGIREALMHDEVKCVVLSNDDVFNIVGMKEMVEWAMRSGGYAAPTVNGEAGTFIVTRSKTAFIAAMGLKKKAPFYALRFIRTVSGIEGACYPRPAILGRSRAVLNVQPMSVISRELLMHEQFNEDIVNGLEDTELAVRLSRRCGHHWRIDPEWRISHRGGASFKKNRTRPGLFIYNDDRQFRHNFQVFVDAVNPGIEEYHDTRS